MQLLGGHLVLSTFKSTQLSTFSATKSSETSLWSNKNFRSAILRAISIAVEPLSEKYTLEAHPTKNNVVRELILVQSGNI